MCDFYYDAVYYILCCCCDQRFWGTAEPFCASVFYKVVGGSMFPQVPFFIDSAMTVNLQRSPHYVSLLG